VSLGVEQYPEGIYDVFKKYFSRVTLINGFEMATENGNPRTMGIIVLGHLSRYLDVSPDIWHSVIRQRVPKKAVDINLRAFEMGGAVPAVS
jgi:indolepyruvate ferredoxin oxidoreductase beta subunit